MNPGKLTQSILALIAVVSMATIAGGAAAQQAASNDVPSDAQAMAEEVANPLTEVTFFPVRVNFDRDVGPLDGTLTTINLQPLTSFNLNENWNLLSRTIIPFVYEDDVLAEGSSSSGLGDITQSFFLSPEIASEDAWAWGVGAIVSLPTASKDEFGVDHFAAGPTAIAVKETGPWVFGGLVSYSRSIDRGDGDPKVDAFFVQPFVDYTTDNAVLFEPTTEATFDREEDEWSIPLEFTANKFFEVGNYVMAVGGGPRYWIESPDSGPEGWGVNFSVYFFLPN